MDSPQTEIFNFDGTFKSVTAFLRRFKAAMAAGERARFEVHMRPTQERLTFPDPEAAAAAAMAEACRMALRHTRALGLPIEVTLK